MIIKEKDWSAIKVTEDNIQEVLKFVDLEGELDGAQEELVAFIELNGIPVVTKTGITLASFGSIIIESKGKFYVLNESGE